MNGRPMLIPSAIPSAMRARALGPDISVAILAVDHATGEVLARVNQMLSP